MQYKKIISIILLIIILFVIYISITSTVYTNRIYNVFETILEMNDNDSSREDLYNKVKDSISKEAFDELEFNNVKYKGIDKSFMLFAPYPICCLYPSDYRYITYNYKDLDGNETYTEITFCVRLKSNFDIYIENIIQIGNSESGG